MASSTEACGSQVFAGPARLIVGPEPVCVELNERVELTINNGADVTPADTQIKVNDIPTGAAGLGQIEDAGGAPGYLLDNTIGQWAIAKSQETGEIMLIKDAAFLAIGSAPAIPFGTGDTILVARGVSFDRYLKSDAMTTFATTITDGTKIDIIGYLFPPLIFQPAYASNWENIETEGDVVVTTTTESFKTRTNQSGYQDSYSLVPEVTVTAELPKNTSPYSLRNILPSEFITHDGQLTPLNWQRLIGRPSGLRLRGAYFVIYPEYLRGRTIAGESIFDRAATDGSVAIVDFIDLSTAWLIYNLTANLTSTYTYGEGTQINFAFDSMSCESNVIECLGTHGCLYYGKNA